MNKFTPTHHGLFCGIVPIRVDMTDPEMPGVEAMGGYAGDLLLEAVEALFGLCVFIRTVIDNDYEPMYPIKITGEVE